MRNKLKLGTATLVTLLATGSVAFACGSGKIEVNNGGFETCVTLDEFNALPASVQATADASDLAEAQGLPENEDAQDDNNDDNGAADDNDSNDDNGAADSNDGSDDNGGGGGEGGGSGGGEGGGSGGGEGGGGDD